MGSIAMINAVALTQTSTDTLFSDYDAAPVAVQHGFRLQRRIINDYLPPQFLNDSVMFYVAGGRGRININGKAFPLEKARSAGCIPIMCSA